MKCKACHRDGLPDDAVFCCYCGQRLRKTVDDISVPPPKRDAKGNYVNRIMVDGERISIKEPTEKAYYAKAKAYKSKAIETPAATNRGKTGAVIDAYIQDNSGTLSESTLRSYRSYRKYRFQTCMEKDITSVNWQAAISQESKSVSPKTVKNAYALVTAAARHSGITLPDVNLPPVPHKERSFLTYDEILKLVELAKGNPDEIGILLALHSLRRSEIYAITAADIYDNALHVHSGMVVDSDNNKVIKQTAKTDAGTRTIPIMINRLSELINGKNGNLYTGNINRLYKKVNKLCNENGLPAVGVHGLRHSFASLCWHLSIDIKSTMRLGGWHDFSTIESVYTHLAAADLDENINKIKQFYSK